LEKGPQNLDIHYLIEHTFHHRAKFHGDRPTELGNFARGKRNASKTLTLPDGPISIFILHLFIKYRFLCDLAFKHAWWLVAGLSFVQILWRWRTSAHSWQLSLWD